MKVIDRIVPIELDGKVTLRLYTGKTFVDARITTRALALAVSDLAKLLCSVHQRLDVGDTDAGAKTTGAS